MTCVGFAAPGDVSMLSPIEEPLRRKLRAIARQRARAAGQPRPTIQDFHGTDDLVGIDQLMAEEFVTRLVRLAFPGELPLNESRLP